MIKPYIKFIVIILCLVLFINSDSKKVYVSDFQQLMHHIDNNNEKEVRKLIKENRKLLDMSDRKGLTPLNYAIYKGNIKIVRFFLRQGLDINLRTVNDDTSLMYAISGKNLKMVKYLIRKGADVNLSSVENLSPLIWSVFKQNQVIMRELLRKGADPNNVMESGENALIIASCVSNVEIVKELIEVYGFDVNYEDSDGNTALLHSIATNSDTELIKVLLDHGANINQIGYKQKTALHIATDTGKENFVRFLIENGANIEEHDVEGLTPFHIACFSENVNNVLHLINAGADIHARTKQGLNALMLIMLQSDLRYFSSLYLGEGAQEHFGYHTLLSSGLSKDEYQIFKMLMDKGIDINNKDCRGLSALMFAAIIDLPRVVMDLIEAGVDLYSISNEGMTALDYAESHHRERIEFILRREMGLEQQKIETIIIEMDGDKYYNE